MKVVPVYKPELKEQVGQAVALVRWVVVASMCRLEAGMSAEGR